MTSDEEMGKIHRIMTSLNFEAKADAYLYSRRERLYHKPDFGNVLVIVTEFEGQILTKYYTENTRLADLVKVVESQLRAGEAITVSLKSETDLEKYTKLLKSFGITPEIKTIDGWDDPQGTYPNAKVSVETQNNKIGYFGFSGVYLFDENGKYLASGHYE